MENEYYVGYYLRLNTQKLKTFFDNSSDANKLLKSTFKKYGAEYKKDFGYVTKEKMSMFEGIILIIKLFTDLYWLSACLDKFEIMSVGETVDKTHLFRGANN